MLIRFSRALEEHDYLERNRSDCESAVPLPPCSAILDSRILTTFIRGWDPEPPWEKRADAATPDSRSQSTLALLHKKDRMMWIQNCSDALRREVLYRTSAHIDLRTILERQIGPPNDLFAQVQGCWTARVYGLDHDGHTIFCERACEIDLPGLLAIETQWPGAVLKARAKYVVVLYTPQSSWYMETIERWKCV